MFTPGRVSMEAFMTTLYRFELKHRRRQRLRKTKGEEKESYALYIRESTLKSRLKVPTRLRTSHHLYDVQFIVYAFFFLFFFGGKIQFVSIVSTSGIVYETSPCLSATLNPP